MIVLRTWVPSPPPALPKMRPARKPDAVSAMHSSLADSLAGVVGRRPVRLRPLSGGCIATVTRADFADGSSVVAKSAGPDGTLDIEAFMLGYLAQHSRLPVPRVLHASPSLLVMEFIDGESRFSASAEVH